MIVQVFQHVPFEELGTIAHWIAARRGTIRYTRFFDDAAIPPLDDVDLLVALGGPMSVNDEAELPWLVREKQAVRDAIARQIPVLGVCLGAQLIASALGSRVYRQAHKEIGWFPIEGTATAQSPIRFPTPLDVFHWHGETFDLPSGATRLARSPACENQAFCVNGNVIGLQFHLEMAPANIAAIVDHCRDELVPGPYVQSEREMLAAPPAAFAATQAMLDSILGHITTTRLARL